MNRTEFVRKVAKKAGVSIVTAKAVVDAIFGFYSRGGKSDPGLITSILMRKGKIAITGFGVFDTAHSAGRWGRSPITGDEIAIESSRRPRFRMSRQIRAALREKFLGEPAPAVEEDDDDLDEDGEE